MVVIVLGLTVFNRRHLLELSARSLHALLSDNCRLIIVNDGSTEFSEQDLRELFPDAIIQTNEKNSGRADFAIAQLADLLLQQDAQYVALLDSDLMYHASFVSTVLDAMPHTDGMMTTLNADSHKITSTEVDQIPGSANRLVRKDHVGSAGVVWTKELLAEVVRAVPASPTWDWDYCTYLKKSGKRILSVERSIVQHLGFWVGQNSGRMNGDWGLGYPALDPEEAGIVTEMIFLGTKTAFAHLGQDNLSRYLSAHHFRPMGRIEGRGRSFPLKEPLVIETSLFLEAGFYYISVEAAVTRSLVQPFVPGDARLELELVVHEGTVNERRIAEASVSAKRLVRGHSDDALRVEFDHPDSMRVKIRLTYSGAPLRRELQLNGIFIDRI